MKLRIISSIILILLLCIAAVLYSQYSRQADIKECLLNIKTTCREEKLALDMLRKQLLKKDLVGNKIENGQPPQYSLLESMGLLLEYAAIVGDTELCSAILKQIVNDFRSPEGYYYWRVSLPEKKASTATALVDDLRLIKAIDKLRSPDSRQLNNYFDKISGSIYQFDLRRWRFIDYYDGKKAERLSLFYIDVEALNALAGREQRWDKPCRQALSVLTRAPQNKHGFYPSWYDQVSEEYHYQKQINMIENLYTAINYELAGKDAVLFKRFLEQELKEGKISCRYYLDGSPVTEDESAAVYALAYRFFMLTGYDKYAGECYSKMLSFQINDNSKLRGGFGDHVAESVHSFDQLEALLTIRMKEGNYFAGEGKRD